MIASQRNNATSIVKTSVNNKQTWSLSGSAEGGGS